MSYTTLNLRNAMTFAKPFLKGAPLEIENMEPAVMVGNIVLSTMLGPPFRYRQNRGTVNFPISSISGTDYVRAVANFGFIESAWLIDGASPANQSPLAVAVELAQNSAGLPAKPGKVAPQFDDNSGNITFRFDNVPDQAYTCYVDFQQSAPLMTSPASGWGPVPDYFNYIFLFGFLAIMSLLNNDSRFPIFERWFTGRLLAAQSGLTDQEKDIFLATWASKAMTMKRSDAASANTLAGS